MIAEQSSLRALCMISTLLALALAGCSDDDATESPQQATGTLQFFANGEDFIRQPFVSKDGWEIAFTNFYVNVYGPTAVQGVVEEEEPGEQVQVASEGSSEGRVTPAHAGHPHTGISAGGDHVALAGDYLVDLHQTPEDLPEERTLVGTIARKDTFDNPVLMGNYNTINFSLKPVEFSGGQYTGRCPAMTEEECEEAAWGMVAGDVTYTIRMTGTATCDGAQVCGAEEIVGFDILLLPVKYGNPYESGLAWSSCAWVGDGQPGLVTANGTGEIEMTFHSDHIFGDAEGDAEINDFAPGFGPFALLAQASGSCKAGEDRCIVATEEEVYDGWFDLRDTHPEMEYVYGMLIYSLGTVGHCGEGHCLH
jgi:hypothetical protein